MIDSAAYAEALSRIRAGKPKLAAFFVTACERAATMVDLDSQAVRCVAQLTIASEHTYIDADALLPLAIRRGELSLFCQLAYHLAGLNPDYARVVLARYPTLAVPAGALADDLRSLAGLCSSRVRKGEVAIAFCLSFQEAGTIQILLQQFRAVANASPGAMAELVDSFTRVRKAISEPAFLSWLARGVDLLTSNRVDEGVRYLKARSPESRRVLGISSAVLDDLKRVLKIYATSLAGRELSVVSLESSSFAATAPYSDGRVMFLPPEVRFFGQQEMNERVYTVLAAQQAASVGMGSFGFDFGAIDFRAELADRYGTALPKVMAEVRKQYGKVARSIRERPSGEVEVAFASGRKIVLLETDLERLFYRFPAPDFARELFGLIENCRIQRALSRKYRGLDQDYQLLDNYLWGKRPLLPDPGTDANARFSVALECLIQFTLAGRWKCLLADPDLERHVKAIAAELQAGLERAASVEDSARTCFRVYNLFHDNFAVISYCEQNDVREAFSGVAKQEIRPEIVRDASPDLVKTVAERPRGGEGDRARIRDIDISDRRASDDAAHYIRQAVASGALRLYRYPEFDCAAGSYRPNHCTLYERTLDATEGDFYQRTLAGLRLTHEKTRKRFLALRPEGVELSRRWPSGDEIHLGDAVDYCIDLMRGASPDDTIYFRKVTNTRDTIAAIVVDASSSTDEEVNGKRIIDTEKAALAVLASALTKIGDDFGVFSYFSLGRHKVFFEIVKDFGEPWDHRTQDRIASIRAQASNRDGCVIRHATARLAQHPHKTRLLLLLSDGVPADVGYGGASSAETSEYAIEDTRRAILECRKQGIVPYCITIDRSAKEYIAHLYGDYRYTVIDDVTALPDRLAKLYLRVTG